MRKPILTVSLVVTFVGCYGVGVYYRSYVPGRTYFHVKDSPAAAQQDEAVKTPTAEVSTKESPPSSKDAASDLEKGRGFELTRAIRTLPRLPFQDLSAHLRRRFFADYPKSKHGEIKEEANRMAILQGLARYREKKLAIAEAAMLTTFLEEVMNNPRERTGPREGAARALLGRCAQLDEKGCQAVMARVPSSLKARASRS